MSELLAAHLDHLRAGGYSNRTIEARRDVLVRLHNKLPYGLAYAATEQIEAWLANPTWSRWTRATYAGHVRGFYIWGDLSGSLIGDPTVEMIRPRPPRCVPNPVTDDELAHALTSAHPWFTAVVLAAYEGLRADEIAHARRENITADTVYVPDGKGGDPGVVPTHPYVWEVVAGMPRGPLVTDHGRPVDGRWISAHARHHFDSLGLPGVRMHRFRDWYGTMIQRSQGDIRVTQECLRHKSVTSTEGYTLVAGTARRAAVVALPVPVLKAAPARR